MLKRFRTFPQADDADDEAWDLEDAFVDQEAPEPDEPRFDQDDGGRERVTGLLDVRCDSGADQK